MYRIRKVLVPVDFSRGSLKAIGYAMSLASRFEASITLLHVLEIPAGLPADAEIHPEPDKPQSVVQYLRDAALKNLRRVEDELSSAGVAASHILVEGHPHEAILAAVTSADIDQIVMGTHGRTGLKHMFLGSIAERVVRHSPCPVTTVREEESDEPSEALRRLYAELDG